jgi:hypothetical protein
LLVALVGYDALCINQADLGERSHQVQLMRDIYQRAELCFVYLGEGYGDEQLAIDLCRRIHFAEIFHASQDKFHPENIGLPSMENESWYALQRLILNPWFLRVWIIQEFSVASKVLFACGTILFGPNILQGLHRALFRLGIYRGLWQESPSQGDSTQTYKSMSCIDLLYSLRIAVQSGNMLRLSTLLSRDIVHGATDPWDQVFALLGLVSNSESLTPNYDLDARKVFISCCNAMFSSKDNDIDYLYDAGHYEKNLSLPSWVPDWTVKRESESLGRVNDRAIKPQYRATGDMKALYRLINATLLPVGVLNLAGSIVDVITQVGTKLELFSEGHTVDFDSFRSWFVQSESFIAQVKLQPSTNIAQKHMDIFLTDNLYNPRTESYIDTTYYEAYKEIISLDMDTEVSISTLIKPTTFSTLLMNRCRGRRFCLTRDQRVGQVPVESQIGDEICILRGLRVPFVVRQEGDKYLLIGECYIDGLMYEEALYLPNFEFQDIEFI